MGVDGIEEVVVFLQRAQRAVPVHQRRVPAPLLSGGCDEAARGIALEPVLVVVRSALSRIKPAVDEHFLDMHRFAQHRQGNCIHVVAVDPDLAHDDIGGALALDLGGRCPDMLGQVAEGSGGGAVGLEDGLVAEQDGDGDGQDNGEQPMPGRGSAVGLERAADGVRGVEPWWFSGTRAAFRGGRVVWGSSDSPTQRIEKIPDHGMPGRPRVCDALSVECDVYGCGAC